MLLYDRSTTYLGTPRTAMKPSHLQPVEPAAPADADGVSLPAWIYRDAEFFERERDCVFRGSWQLVCHLSDVPQPGDFHTFEFLGEAVLVLRGEEGAVRAFHNVCRHRAPRPPRRAAPAPTPRGTRRCGSPPAAARRSGGTRAASCRGRRNRARARRIPHPGRSTRVDSRRPHPRVRRVRLAAGGSASWRLRRA